MKKKGEGKGQMSHRLVLLFMLLKIVRRERKGIRKVGHKLMTSAGGWCVWDPVEDSRKSMLQSPMHWPWGLL